MLLCRWLLTLGTAVSAVTVCSGSTIEEAAICISGQVRTLAVTAAAIDALVVRPWQSAAVFMFVNRKSRYLKKTKFASLGSHIVDLAPAVALLKPKVGG